MKSAPVAAEIAVPASILLPVNTTPWAPSAMKRFYGCFAYSIGAAGDQRHLSSEFVAHKFVLFCTQSHVSSVRSEVPLLAALFTDV